MIEKDKKRPLFLLLTVVLSIALLQSAFAQPPTQYVYDNNGRLRAVVATDNQASVYYYDAAGNITAIRSLASTTREFIEMSPRGGSVGTRVTIHGVRIGDNNPVVSFTSSSGPARANVVVTNSTTIVTEVPANATYGPITITFSGGTPSTLSLPPFQVSGIQVTPSDIVITSFDSLQFTAQPSVSSNWSIANLRLDSLDASAGTIGESSGLYTAPDLPAYLASRVFYINASRGADSGEAQVTVKNLNRVYGVFSSGVLVTTGPVIRSLSSPSCSTSPCRLPRGGSARITITGENLNAVTGIFTVPRSPSDTGISFSIVPSVPRTATQITVDVVIGTAVQIGTVVVVAAMPALTSTRFDKRGNAIEVVAER